MPENDNVAARPRAAKPAKRYPQCILATCVVPWDEHGEVIENAFRQQVRYFISHGIRHLYIFGTAGEGHAVDTRRFKELVQLFRDETRQDGIDPQVGVIGLSTANIIERISIGYDAGFRMFQLSLPCWSALNDREVLTFFRDVCNSFPDCRFLHYNIANAKRVLEGQDYRVIVDVVPNLVAIKATDKHIYHILRLMRDVPELQCFFAATLFAFAIQYEEVSLLADYACLFPAKSKELFGHGVNQQFDQLIALANAYWDATETVLAPTRRIALTDTAYHQLIARLAGLEMPLRSLSPYENFPESVFRECQEILQTRYKDWVV